MSKLLRQPPLTNDGLEESSPATLARSWSRSASQYYNMEMLFRGSTREVVHTYSDEEKC